MPMGVNRFAGFDQLHSQVQRMAGALAHAGMDQADRPARAFIIGRYKLTGGFESGADLRPLP